MSKMDREDAIYYLQRKGKIKDLDDFTDEEEELIAKTMVTREEAIEKLRKKEKLEQEEKFDKNEEEKIEEVMKKGKIYGDPVAEIY